MKKFFQIFGIFVFSVFILIVLVLFAGLIFLKTFDIKKYKPQIIASATNALGRAVNFNDIDLAVSMEKGVRFHLTDFSIAENPDFGNENFVTVKQIDLGVDLVAFLTTRQISVPGILIDSPQISIIRNSKGLLNFQSMAAKQEASQSAALTRSSAIPVIFINSLKIENAQIVLIDQTVVPELKLDVSQATLEVKEFSLTKPFDVLLDAAVLSDQKNFSFNAKAQLDLAKLQLMLSEMDLGVNLSQLPLEKLKALPSLAQVTFPRILDGQLKFKIHQLELSSKGVEKFNTDIYLTNAKVVADEFVPGISLEARRLNISCENFSLDNTRPLLVSVKAALYQEQTNFDLSAKVLLDPQKMQAQITDAEFSTDLALWPLAKIKSAIVPLKDVALPEDLSGKFKVSIKEALVSSSGLQSVLLDLNWQDGTILLKDILPGALVALAKTDVKIENFSFGKQFSVSLKSAYLSESQNVSFSGAVALDLNTQEVSIKNGIAEFNTNSFDLERFKALGLVPANIVFPQTLAGVFQAQINDLNASPKGLGPMNVDLKWQNGKIVVNELAPGISLAADQVNIKVTDFSLIKPFALEATLGYESDEPNLSFKGQVLLDPSAQKVSITEAAFKTDLAKVSLEQIKTKIVSLKDVSLPEKIKGELEVAIANVSVGPAGLLALASDVTLKNWEVKLKELLVPISGVAAKFKVTENQISADEFAVNLGQGQIVSKIDVTDYMRQQNFDLTTQIKGLELSQLLDQTQASLKVGGSVFANFKAKGQGADIKSMAADGSFEVKQAKLMDLNVLKTVLDKISFIPDLASRIEAKLPENYKVKLDDKDTQINEVSGTFNLNSGNILVDPIAVKADEFVFEGKSNVNFEQVYTLDGAFKITRELSAIMGQSTEELTYLYDADNNISLPVHISGKGSQTPVISVMQSALDLGKNAARNEGKKELGKILDKALGIPRDSQNQQQAQDPSTLRQESTGEQIIGGILDKVFK